MKQTIELDEFDIKQILAKYFETDEKNVSVFTTDKMSGYGQGEYIVSVPGARIVK